MMFDRDFRIPKEGIKVWYSDVEAFPHYEFRPAKPLTCSKDRPCFFCWLKEESRLREVECARWEDDGGSICSEQEPQIVYLDSLGG
jgi:hypothetical protein